MPETQTSKQVDQIAEFSFVQRCTGNPENTRPDKCIGTPERLGTHRQPGPAIKILECDLAFEAVRVSENIQLR
jgi:hypothetical protein